MKLLSKTAVFTGALLLITASVGALADWELDGERSTVQFMSVKNSSVAELHHFRAITGGISDTGAAQVALDLDSVETLVPIRNQRIRELLFETVRFPAAMLRAEVPPSLTELPKGETRDTAIEVEVDLHGATQSYIAEVLVTRLSDGGLQVVISEPIVVKAADFGLDGGIDILREVAGLKSISTAVPVSGQLVFRPSVD